MKNTLLFLIIFSLSTTSLASEMAGAISAGMGGTGRASVESNESIFLNPASIALINRFYVGTAYQSGFLAKDVSRNTYSVVMSDGTSGTFLPGSFAYRKHSINSQGQRLNEDELKVGFAYRISPRVSAGVSYAYMDARSIYGQGYNQSNGDVGLLIGLQPNWGFSITGENIIKSDENMPLALQRSSQVSLGTQYVYETYITFRYEALMPLHTENTEKIGHRVGFGAAMQANFFLNVGYSVDDYLSQNWSSVGLAWRGPRMKLAYSYQNEDRQGLGVRHLVDLWMDI